MSNYSIVAEDAASLVLAEKTLNRVLLGAFLLAFGAIACWLSLSESTRGGVAGRTAGALIGAVSLAVGSVSILRRGSVRIDQARRRFEFFGGSQKFRSSPRVIAFDDIAALAIRTVEGRHRSYAIELIVRNGPDLVLDQTVRPEYANSLGEKVARRVGCELRGRAV